jgi:metal-responsive CopG/Arc/MetJ family transcriptional regulator
VVARTHVVISDETLRQIDRLVGERSRSRFLEEAAREKLERLALSTSLEETAGIAGARAYPEWRDRRAASEWVRRTRRTEAAS